LLDKATEIEVEDVCLEETGSPRRRSSGGVVAPGPGGRDKRMFGAEICDQQVRRLTGQQRKHIRFGQ